MPKHSSILLVLFTCASLMAMPALGAGTPGGKWSLTPKIGAHVLYDSNYYKTENRETDVYTFRLSPGFEAGYKAAHTEILTEYTLRANFYDGLDDTGAAAGPGQPDPSDDNFVGHEAQLNFTTRPGARTEFTLSEVFIRTREPGSADRFNRAADRSEYWVNRLTPGVVYKLGGRFLSKAHYSWEEMGHDSDAREDSTEHRGVFNLVYHLQPRVALDMEMQAWWRDYEGGLSDYRSVQGMGIYRHGFAHLTLSAGVGGHARDFDSPAVEDRESLVWRAAAAWEDPPGDGQPRTMLGLTAERNYNNIDTANNYYVATALEAMAGHRLGGFLFGVRAVYQRNDYHLSPGPADDGTGQVNREDDTWEFSGTVGYEALEWLTLDFKTGYETRESNVLGEDYDNVSVTFGFRARYELADLFNL